MSTAERPERLETLGVAPIPDERRTMTASRVFVVWAMASASALTPILGHISSFLDSIGDALFPFTFVMLVDWLYVQRRATPVQRFFDPPRARADWVSLPAALAFCVGCAFSIWFGDIAPGWWLHQVPTPFIGALISGGLYALLAVTPAPLARLLPGCAHPAPPRWAHPPVRAARP